MNIDRIKKAADAVKWHRRTDLLDNLLKVIEEELRPLGAKTELPAAFQREDRFLILKRADIEEYALPGMRNSLGALCATIEMGRAKDGKRRNAYVVVADDWPEYEETWAKIQARMEGNAGSVTPAGAWLSRNELEHEIREGSKRDAGEAPRLTPAEARRIAERIAMASKAKARRIGS